MFDTASKERLDPVRAAFAVVVGIYYLWGVWDLTGRWRITGGVDYFVHEGGHLISMPFGSALSVVAGSMLQVVMPALLVLYFHSRGQPYSAALVLLWVGDSVLNVSAYIGDATTAPMVGENGLIHDWKYILGHLGLLWAAPLLSALIRILAISTMLAATYLALKNSYVTRATKPTGEVTPTPSSPNHDELYAEKPGGN